MKEYFVGLAFAFAALLCLLFAYRKKGTARAVLFIAALLLFVAETVTLLYMSL